jgi:hypothetical protein
MLPHQGLLINDARRRKFRRYRWGAAASVRSGSVPGGLSRRGPPLYCADVPGGVAEWLKALAWKACIRETVSWVRIPLPPPASSQNALRPRVGPSWKRIICPIAAMDLWTPISGRRSEMTLCKASFSGALYSEVEVRFWRKHKISAFRMPFSSPDLEIHSLVQFESAAVKSRAPKSRGSSN